MIDRMAEASLPISVHQVGRDQRRSRPGTAVFMTVDDRRPPRCCTISSTTRCCMSG
jgi:hypothetical protein